jgi:hypothetical protein
MSTGSAERITSDPQRESPKDRRIFPRPTWLLGLAGLGGAVAGIWAGLQAWDSMGLPRLAMRSEVMRVEHSYVAADRQFDQRLAQIEQQQIQTHSMVLNERLVSTEARLYQNLEAQQQFKTRGEPVPSWMIEEWLRLEREKQDLLHALDVLQTTPQ